MTYPKCAPENVNILESMQTTCIDFLQLPSQKYRQNGFIFSKRGIFYLLIVILLNIKHVLILSTKISKI